MVESHSNASIFKDKLHWIRKAISGARHLAEEALIQGDFKT